MKETDEKDKKEIFKENREYKDGGSCLVYLDEESGQYRIANDITEAEENAVYKINKHTIWFRDMITKVYQDAMKHGYKHGYEDGYEDAKNEVK